MYKFYCFRVDEPDADPINKKIGRCKYQCEFCSEEEKEIRKFHDAGRRGAMIVLIFLAFLIVATAIAVILALLDV